MSILSNEEILGLLKNKESRDKIYNLNFEDEENDDDYDDYEDEEE
jgi:hypothetical protein